MISRFRFRYCGAVLIQRWFIVFDKELRNCILIHYVGEPLGFLIAVDKNLMCDLGLAHHSLPGVQMAVLNCCSHTKRHALFFFL